MTAEEEPTPAEVLAELDALEAAVAESVLWHASKELDGEAATIRRAIDVALGEGPPTFLEVAPGVVLELNHHNPGGNTP